MYTVKGRLYEITWTLVRAQSFLSTIHGSKLPCVTFVKSSISASIPVLSSKTGDQIFCHIQNPKWDYIRRENKISFSNNLKKVSCLLAN